MVNYIPKFSEMVVFMNCKSLKYDRIYISERIDFNKTNPSKECDICHYCYFKGIGFKYEPYLCNGSYDLMQKPINFDDVAIVSVKGK